MCVCVCIYRKQEPAPGNSPYYNRNPDTEALYCSQKRDPTTTGQLYAQKGSSSLCSMGLCEQYSVVRGLLEPCIALSNV